MAIAPGPYTLKGKAAATTDTIARVATTIADGKSYSFYQSGIYNSTTKTVDAFVVEDPFVPAIDYSVAYVRFVHAISNANPLTLYARPSGDTVTAHWAAVGAEVAYKSAGPFTALSEGVYDLPHALREHCDCGHGNRRAVLRGQGLYRHGARQHHDHRFHRHQATLTG